LRPTDDAIAKDRLTRREGRGDLRQAAGGPRAKNAKCGNDAEPNWSGVSSTVPPTIAGTGNGGATDGAEVLANWIKAQIGQSKSAGLFGF